MKKLHNIYLIKIFTGHWCKLIFVFALIIGYFLIPKTVFVWYLTLLSVAFLLLFALVTTCLIKNIKEKVIMARTRRVGTFGIIAIILGFSALQMCALNSVCLVGAGAGIIGIIFPSIMFSFMEKYAIWVLSVSTIIEIGTLYYMGCFKCFSSKNNEQVIK